MQMFNLGLTILFAAGALWMCSKVLQQRKDMVIACKYLNGYHIFILVCFTASILTLLFGFEDVLDALRTITMILMVGMFLCLREGAGKTGFIYNASVIHYESVVQYDYKAEKKGLRVYIVFKEQVKNGTQDDTITLLFKKEDEKQLLELLENKLPKKHKRMKKA